MPQAGTLLLSTGLGHQRTMRPPLRNTELEDSEMNRSGTGRVQHQAARVAMPGTARTSKATSPMASRDNSFRNTDPGLTRAKGAGTVHHIIGLAQGGDPEDPANLAPAHRSCNCRDGAVKLLEVKRQHRIIPARNSRNW
jgi:5-methylcytosine-specific restriction endonuclease McrA